MVADGPLPMELLERGDPAFVDAIRGVAAVGPLADLAKTWHDDRRPASRRLLLDYLGRPLDARGHQGLLKRLFKRAEAAGDDGVMARFLVGLDRSVRRARHLDRSGPFRLATRHYLRRRAWRYFRNLGKHHPGRYVEAASEALALYRDEDSADGPSLLDNWGLVHILFHHGPALFAGAGGWGLRPGRSLAELAPAPIFESLWDEAPGAVVDLLSRARCRVVRRWAIRRVEADPSRMRASRPVDAWVELLDHDDPDVVALAAGLLRDADGLDAVATARWLDLAVSTGSEAVLGLIARIVRPERVGLDRAVKLASAPDWATARLGLDWLEAGGTEGDRAGLLGLIEARCEPLRPLILRWLRAALAAEPDAALVLLESRHADARAEGLAWFLADPRIRDDPALWARLLRSTRGDVRLALVADLEARADAPGRFDPERALDAPALAAFWAAVLLDVERGHRARPLVVRQIARRLKGRPDDAPTLLPLLGVALRSTREPERRAALGAVVGLVEARPEAESAVRSAFPELQWA